MPKITRKHQKQFGVNAPVLTQAGSTQTGTPVTSRDLDVLQGSAAWETGLTGQTIVGDKVPEISEQDAIHNVTTTNLAYTLQEGIPEYEATTPYFQNSVVKKIGTVELYKSLTDDNLGNILTDTVNWEFAGDLRHLKNAIGENYSIYPNFEIWLEGTSITNTTGNDFYGSVLTGGNCGTGGSPSMTLSRQAFTLGQTDVPSEPKYFFRGDLTAAASVTQPTIQHKIESVRTNADGTTTASFYAKAGATSSYDLCFVQNFGTGGSPSLDVVVASQVAVLTTSWQLITKTFTLPSLTGKALGTDENSDHLIMRLKYPLAATNIVDIANLKIEKGNVATGLGVVSFGEELRKSKRYAETSYRVGSAIGSSDAQNDIYSKEDQFFTLRHTVLKKSPPTLNLYNSANGNIGFCSDAAGNNTSAVTFNRNNTASFTRNAVTSTAGGAWFHFFADSRY